MMLPNFQLFNKISQYISKRGGKNYSLFLLGSQAGLRVSEAISFNYKTVQQNNFYLVRSKGKNRSVYVPPSVISELRHQNWQPNSLTRQSFYKFLQKTKRELNLPKNIELTPHILRHHFTTCRADRGIPLPVLSKALGHSSVRTTALYWKSDKEISDKILTEWLEPNSEKTPKLTNEQRRKIVNHNYYLKNREKLKKERRTKYQNQKNSLNNLNKVSPISSKEQELALKNQQLQMKITQLEAIISKQKEQKKLKVQIQWEPKKIYG